MTTSTDHIEQEITDEQVQQYLASLPIDPTREQWAKTVLLTSSMVIPLLHDTNVLLDLIEAYAPADRSKAWHQEECFPSTRAWLENQWWVTEGARYNAPIDWSRALDEMHAWVDESMRAGVEPTASELCDEHCLYPVARRLLEQALCPDCQSGAH